MSALLFIHNLLRWILLIALIVSIYKAYRGKSQKLSFTKADNQLRHWTATISHIQLIIGILLYTQSPTVKYYFSADREENASIDLLFFSLIHAGLMLTAVLVLTYGSALAKRKATDAEKHQTVFLFFLVALLVILIAIPWPFSPLANRPYLRTSW